MKLLTAFVLFLFLVGTLSAQKSTSLQKKTASLYSEALTLSQLGNSTKSKQLLDELVKLDPTYFMAYFALADLSHETGDTEGEIRYLRQGLALSGDTYPAGFKFLAEVLFEKGDYSEALTRMDHYAQLRKPLNPAEQLLLESCRFSVNAQLHSVPFQPVNPGDSINTGAEEYWPSLNAEANELVFTRLETKTPSGQTIPKPQEDFYFSRYDSTGWHKAISLGSPVNTDENEGAQTLSADGKFLIFTGCGRAEGVGGCDLYISMNSNGVWSVPVNMGEPVNSGAWESQPALSADGETLFFVSSRMGGKGKMDIWKARKTATTADKFPLFGEVTNVGELNTAGNDLSPFLHADGKTIFFASDGRPGLGGSDLFSSTLEGNHFKDPVNLGYPLNTNKNEEGLVVELSGDRAWFTSDRNPARGRDLFYFALPDSLRPEPVSYLKGVIKDAKTGLKINAEIVLTNLTTGKMVRSILPAENDGEFLVCLPSGINYGLTITRKGYLFSSENISLMDGFSKIRPKEMEVRLHPIVAGTTTTLNNIFFETNSWKLKEESTTQLNEMTKFMEDNPEVIIEVVGHTDRVGTEGYNLELSRKRAESVVQELVQRKIDPGRIKSRGAGFSEPVRDNTTEEGRSANRRTEFLVKELKSLK